MKHLEIEKVIGREIVDSRGNPDRVSEKLEVEEVLAYEMV